MARGKKKALRTGRSLNLILWCCFTLFALILLILFITLQTLFVSGGYRAQTVELLRRASGEMEDLLTDADALDASLRMQLTEVGERYDVTFRFLTLDGRSAFSDAGYELYPEIAEDLKGRLSAQGERTVTIREEDLLAYASLVEKGGETYFLYLSSSLARLEPFESGLLWLSLAIALFSVVLAFAVSGAVSLLITKPVTEVTDRAKALARGEYGEEEHRDYYCLEMAELSDALDYARREIGKSDAMQRELIANVSHDFKTPLTMIKAYASMIREISGSNEQKRNTHAQIIIDETDRLTNLVNDVLDLSKLRAGVGKELPVHFDLSEEVTALLERFRYLEETEGYTFEKDIEAGITVFAARERILQVVYNLVGNAVNYTGEDKRVAIRLFRTAAGCRLEVEDTGQGIPEEERATIWDRYYRSSETHRRPVGGTGLGLSIVKSILISQKCPFGVLSEEGKGSIFWVEFIDETEEDKV